MSRVIGVINFLKDMQIEKVCVFGEEDARDRNSKIQDIIDDIEMFYEGEVEEESNFDMVSLEDLPVGSLFIYDGVVSVGGSSEPRRLVAFKAGNVDECYIVGSGELFWLGKDTGKALVAPLVI